MFKNILVLLPWKYVHHSFSY